MRWNTALYNKLNTHLYVHKRIEKAWAMISGACSPRMLQQMLRSTTLMTKSENLMDRPIFQHHWSSKRPTIKGIITANSEIVILSVVIINSNVLNTLHLMQCDWTSLVVSSWVLLGAIWPSLLSTIHDYGSIGHRCPLGHQLTHVSFWTHSPHYSTTILWLPQQCTLFIGVQHPCLYWYAPISQLPKIIVWCHWHHMLD